jgi:murein L,D-transpeptidase YcbB/YkuD
MRVLLASVVLLSSMGWSSVAQVPSPSREPVALLDILGDVVTVDERVSTAVARAYEVNKHEPLWTSAAALDAQRLFVHEAANGAAHGLSPDRFDLDEWRLDVATMELDLTAARSNSELLPLDVRLTTRVAEWAAALALGPAPTESARRLDLGALVASAQDGASAARVLRQLPPVHAEYRDLRKALGRYRQVVARGGWRPLPEGTFLAASSTAERLPDEPEWAALALLQARLQVVGDLDEHVVDVRTYDERLEAAVRRFQARHGLVVDGIVGQNTVRALNMPAGERAGVLAANMERWRQLPDDLGDPHIRVNIPAYRLEVHEGGDVTLQMRVVAGEPDWPTPRFSDRVRYLEFRPYWNIPESITRAEMLPRLREDAGALDALRLEIVDGWDEPARVVEPGGVEWDRFESTTYRLRQRPGGTNALGRVKFMFPNEHNVYLHDTPATHRFEDRQRAFSHGCVRVESPDALAAYLLRDQGDWSPAQVSASMGEGETQRVDLVREVDVHLVYFTAWVEDTGVQFRRDVYGHDGVVEAPGSSD